MHSKYNLLILKWYLVKPYEPKILLNVTASLNIFISFQLYFNSFKIINVVCMFFLINKEIEF